ncbi:MAG: DUF58 domain-containing protein [Gammaproteobacteria bacterium]|nr:DUF58 domain-containing protein [Gammaproteobacteria bacterium]
MDTLPGEVVLQRRGLFMLPTRYGWMFAGVLVVLLLASINYNNSLAYGLTFLLSAIAVVSMLHTDRNLLHLQLRAGTCIPVFAGETAMFRIHLLNRGARTRYGIALVHNKREFACVDVAAHATATAEFWLPAPQRGWLSLPPFYVKTQFPLGILYSWSRRLVLDERCLIYPKPSEPWSWRTPSESATDSHQRPTGSGDDFSGVRAYRPGDSPRQIDWKSVARGSGLLTKEFSGGVGETVWLDLAQVPGIDNEIRLSRLCRAVLDAEQAGARYGLRLGATTFAPSCGEAHQHRCLQALALYGTS